MGITAITGSCQIQEPDTPFRSIHVRGKSLNTWTILHCFARCIASGFQTRAHMGCQHPKGNLTCYTTMLVLKFGSCEMVLEGSTFKGQARFCLLFLQNNNNNKYANLKFWVYCKITDSTILHAKWAEGSFSTQGGSRSPRRTCLRAHSALETVHGEQDSSVSEWEEGRQEGKREQNCKANITWFPPWTLITQCCLQA